METDTLSFVLWVVLTIACAFSSLLGVVLAFHLFKYSTSSKIATIATVTYAGVSIALLFSLFALALSL